MKYFLIILICLFLNINNINAGYKQDASKIIESGTITESLLDSSVQSKLNSGGGSESSTILLFDNGDTIELTDTVEIKAGYNIIPKKNGTKDIKFNLKDNLIFNQQEIPSNTIIDDFESYNDIIATESYSETDGKLNVWQRTGFVNDTVTTDYYHSAGHSVNAYYGEAMKIEKNTQDTYIIEFWSIIPSTSQCSVALCVYSDYNRDTKEIQFYISNSGNADSMWCYFNNESAVNVGNAGSGLVTIGDWFKVEIILHQDTKKADLLINNIPVFLGKYYFQTPEISQVAVVSISRAGGDWALIDDIIANKQAHTNNPITWKYEYDYGVYNNLFTITKDNITADTPTFSFNSAVGNSVNVGIISADPSSTNLTFNDANNSDVELRDMVDNLQDINWLPIDAFITDSSQATDTAAKYVVMDPDNYGTPVNFPPFVVGDIIEYYKGQWRVTRNLLNDTGTGIYYKDDAAFYFNDGTDIKSVENVLQFDQFKGTDIDNTNALNTGDFLVYDGTNWLNLQADLDTLSDVDINIPEAKHVLYYDGSDWVNHQLTLNDIYAVNITSPTNKDILQWNGTSHKWENASVNSVGPTIISGLASITYPYGGDAEHILHDTSNNKVYLPRATRDSQIYLGIPFSNGTNWDWEYMASDSRALGYGYFAVIDTANTVFYYGNGGDIVSGTYIPLKNFYKYNYNSQTVTTLASTPSGVKYAPAVMYNNKIFVFGGSISTDRNAANNTSDAIQIYDIATDSWSTSTYTMPYKASGVGAVVSGQYAYVFGGKDSTSGADTYYKSVYRYDLTDLSQQTQLADIPQELAYFAYVYDSNNNYIYTIGGENTNNSTKLSCVYKYDITNNTWSTLSDYPRPVRLESAYMYDSDTIYVYQFALTSGEFAPSYKYTISNDSWSPIQTGSAVTIDYSSYGFTNIPSIQATLYDACLGEYAWGIIPMESPVVTNASTTHAMLKLGHNDPVTGMAVPANTGMISYTIIEIP